MNLKISTKIILGFGGMLIFVILNAVFISNAVFESKKVNKEINEIYAPSVDRIRALETVISDSRMLIKSWVHIDKIADTPDKNKLKNLHSDEYRSIMDTLMVLSMKHWTNDTHKALLNDIDISIRDTLFIAHKDIMGKLSSFTSYEESFTIFEVTPMVEENGEVMIATKKILDKIELLKNDQEKLIADKRSEMVESLNDLVVLLWAMLIILIFVAVATSTVTILSLAGPINKTKKVLLSISRGMLIDPKLREGSDEIGQMAKALHAVINALKNVSNFAIQIGKGNFSSEFKPLSDDDVLGQSLLEMRRELQKAKEEEEKRDEENKQRTWASQGVALFSDILRTHSGNINELSFEIISQLVQYTNSNQGGVFIVNDNDTDNLFLEMTACYAYDRQKFIKQKIEVGEGLVGRCYQEQEKIFLTDIPKDYIKISSGLGEESPNCLLLVPLAYNDNIFGIIEIASFNVLEEFEIDLIERIGESIAATISSVKSNIQTQLLLERSQQQAEEMSAQEEEMRQNMEELRATQEQSARREQELIRELEALKKQI